MPIQSIRKLVLAGGCLLGLFSGARGQDLLEPLLMTNVSNYGGPRSANTGYWATAEAMSWAISPPERAQVGNTSVTPPVVAVPDGSSFRTEYNTLDTSFLNSELAWGNRFQVGFTGDHWGWMVGGFGLKPSTQKTVAGNTDVVFPDPPFGPGGLGYLNGFIDRNPQDQIDDDINGNGIFGRFFQSDPMTPIDPTNPADRLPSTLWDYGDAPRLPVTFSHVYVQNKNSVWSIELMPYYRTNPTHRAGYFEIGAGVRYFKFFEKFDVRGVGGTLADTEWSTWAGNNIVGPQVMLRWFRTHGRVNLSSEVRYMFGFNNQSISQVGRLATQINTVTNPAQVLPRQNVPLNLDTGFFQSASHPNEFNSLVELRLGAGYQVTKALSATIGWTGVFVDGVARPSNMINYTLPTFGINTNENRQPLFINGINFGLELNR